MWLPGSHGRRRPPWRASVCLLRANYLRSGAPPGRSISSRSRQPVPRMRPPRRSAEETSAGTLFQLQPCSGTSCSESFEQSFQVYFFFILEKNCDLSRSNHRETTSCYSPQPIICYANVTLTNLWKRFFQNVKKRIHFDLCVMFLSVCF